VEATGNAISAGTRRLERRPSGTYVPRRPEDGVLHRSLREHLETFLAEAKARSDGDGLPMKTPRKSGLRPSLVAFDKSSSAPATAERGAIGRDDTVVMAQQPAPGRLPWQQQCDCSLASPPLRLESPGDPCLRESKSVILCSRRACATTIGVSMNWDDLRLFVALAREKTLASASRSIGVDQTTVARRLRALEESLGAVLFERGEGRWQLTSVGRHALRRVERIEEDIAGIVRSAEAESQTVSGVVRLTSVAAMNSEYLVYRLPDLYARHPDLVVDLVDSDANLNIARHEADVAIRASRPESGDFVIRRLTVIGFAVYESARPHVVTGRADWVAYNEDLAQLPEMRWLETHMERGARIRLRDSGMRTLCGAVASGIGRGILPCFVGDTHSELRRWTQGDPVLSRDVWLLIHREARESARVAVVADWLVERCTADAQLFSGLGAPSVRRPRRRS
jgi:DNA-binding transcriptional LysR family regulator